MEVMSKGGRHGTSIKPEVEKLAGIGSAGRYQNNCHRDLEKLADKSTVTMFNVGIPIQVVGAAAAAVAQLFSQSMLLPHISFSAMGNFYPKALAKLMCPGRHRLQQFWSNMDGNP